MTGDTTLRISLTSPPEVTMTVPGAMILSPLGYCWLMERESLPVGTFTFNWQQKSLRASTARYRRASSPFCERQGHIQLADNDTPRSPSAKGAHTMLVKDSATDSTLPASGLARPACGAWPRAVAIPFLPR